MQYWYYIYIMDVKSSILLTLTSYGNLHFLIFPWIRLSGLKRCILKRKVNGSNPTRCLTGLDDLKVLPLLQNDNF